MIHLGKETIYFTLFFYQQQIGSSFLLYPSHARTHVYLASQLFFIERLRNEAETQVVHTEVDYKVQTQVGQQLLQPLPEATDMPGAGDTATTRATRVVDVAVADGSVWPVPVANVAAAARRGLMATA